MTKYHVRVKETAYFIEDYEIEAPSREQAEMVALDRYGREGSSDIGSQEDIEVILVGEIL
jgi:hypothetical protein